VEVGVEIRKRMKWDAWVDDGLISVAVDDGEAVLTGAVGSAMERSRAISNAWVPGVREVDATGLEVQWWARDQMRRDKYAPRTDAQVAQAVQDAFFYDPRVLSFHPEVRVDDGVVTLSGVVDNLEARRAAEQDATNTVGVTLVRNHLRVRPKDEVGDAELTQKAERALRRDPLVDRFDVGLTTFRGEVSLAGEVDSWIEKMRAETVVAGVQGVVDIHNNIRVAEPPAHVTDRAIEESIEDEIFWSPLVDAGEIHVTVDSRVATLTGTVDTWAEYSWAAHNAREGGASRVRNKIKVRNDQGAFSSPFALPFSLPF
jgi:osmotically-inducible protein OsmY